MISDREEKMRENKTKLQRYRNELYYRVLYVFGSFFLAWISSYANSTSLLFLIVMQYSRGYSKFILSSSGEDQNSSPRSTLEGNADFKDSHNKVLMEPVKAHEEDFLTADNKQSLLDNKQSLLYACKGFEEESTIAPLWNTLLDTQKSTQWLSSAAPEGFQTAQAPRFILTDPTEGLTSAILVCNLFSFFTVVPLLLYAFISFFLTSWFKNEAKKRVRLVGIVYTLWLFWLFLVQESVPELTSFLLQFQSKNDILQIFLEPKVSSLIYWLINIYMIANLIFLLIIIFVSTTIFWTPLYNRFSIERSKRSSDISKPKRIPSKGVTLSEVVEPAAQSFDHSSEASSCKPDLSAGRSQLYSDRRTKFVYYSRNSRFLQALQAFFVRLSAKLDKFVNAFAWKKDKVSSEQKHERLSGNSFPEIKKPNFSTFSSFGGSEGVYKQSFITTSRSVRCWVLIVFAAILSPPDFVMQFSIAIILFFVSEVGVFLVLVFQRWRFKV